MPRNTTYMPINPHSEPTIRAARSPCRKNSYSRGSTRNSMMVTGEMQERVVGDQKVALMPDDDHVAAISSREDVVGKNIMRLTLRHHAFIEADHPGQMRSNCIEVMRTEQNRDAITVDITQQMQYLMLGLDIHAGSRFIQHQELGIID